MSVGGDAGGLEATAAGASRATGGVSARDRGDSLGAEDNPTPRSLVLTGGSRGIGHETAKFFRARGWRVITCSREDLPDSCRGLPGWTHYFPVDLAERDQVQAFAQAVNAELGSDPLHALVNNAAISPKTPFKERLGCLNGSIDHWHWVFDLNFFAPLLLSRGLATALARGRGAIVNITSIAGHAIHPFAGSAYSTSKAALSALTREMAVEFGQLGVRVNAVAPGEIETAMLSPEYEELVPRIPLQRLGTPADVAGTVFWLCSPDSEYISGTEIFVTGGQHIY